MIRGRRAGVPGCIAERWTGYAVMALQRTYSMSHESTSFRTKEGTYKKGSFQYCRETRKAHSGKELGPVTTSFVSCKDKEGTKEWIMFNSAKEFYFYPFHGMRKVSRRAKSGNVTLNSN